MLSNCFKALAATRILRGEAFRHLIHHCQAHGDMKPIKQVFGLGIQIELQFSNRVRRRRRGK